MAPLACALCLVCAVVQAAGGGPLSATADVEKDELFLGESITFQVEITGSDHPGEPDLSALTDFRVEPLGGQTRNSESITIINGRMSRVVRRGYVFSYRLTPKRTGRLVIPALEVDADGQRLRTEPIVISVNEPAETEDFKLRLTLSKTKCYVGEPVTLTVTWYIGKEVRGFQFMLPFLDDRRFRVHDAEVEIDRTKSYLRVPLESGEVVAEKGQGRLDGQTYATVSFSKVLIPSRAGTFDIARATVVFDALVGYRRSRDIFDDFFSDDFFGGSRGVYERFVVPSNSPTLTVLELPAEGRPANFAGHVGRYRIHATASPTEANVGDPITLVITLSGPDYLRDVELPPLSSQPALARDFKIPQEMAAGKVEGKTKVFTQTIRATHAGVTQIPPIALAYFDTDSGKYDVARSRPIPLTIHGTRVVTARDAEGRELSTPKSELTVWSQGIAHNYEDLSILENQRYGLAALIDRPFWAATTLGPMAIYCLLLISTTMVRQARADPEGRKARRSYGRLRKRLQAAAAAAGASEVSREVLEAFREYLGSKLRLTSSAITYRDVESPLAERGVPGEMLQELRSLFQECEAGQYAGGDPVAESTSTAERALALAKRLEAALR